MASHVLHLIPSWRAVARELVRVVRRGGVILIDPGGWNEGVWGEVQHFFASAAEAPGHPGLEEVAELDDLMASLGASLRPLPPVWDVTRSGLGPLIDRLENGIYSFTWSLDEDVRKSAAAATRSWAATKFGSLEWVRAHVHAIEYRAYDVRKR